MDSKENYENESVESKKDILKDRFSKYRKLRKVLDIVSLVITYFIVTVLRDIFGFTNTKVLSVDTLITIIIVILIVLLFEWIITRFINYLEDKNDK